MGKSVRCPECGEVYRTLVRIEDLRDNDSICLVCNAPIEVADWDRVLASYEEDDFDDVDDLEEVDDEHVGDWQGEDAIEDGVVELEMDSEVDAGDDPGDDPGSPRQPSTADELDSDEEDDSDDNDP